jgi:hypothetical protein
VHKAMSTFFCKFLAMMLGHPNVWDARETFPVTQGRSRNLRLILTRYVQELVYLFPKPALKAAVWSGRFGGFGFPTILARTHNCDHAHTCLQRAKLDVFNLPWLSLALLKLSCSSHLAVSPGFSPSAHVTSNAVTI